jgi:hypothetical protein
MKGYSLSLLWLCSLCLIFSSCHHEKDEKNNEDNNITQVSANPHVKNCE